MTKHFPLFLILMLSACAGVTTQDQLVEKDPVKMVLVPETEYTMGSATGDPDEQPIHKVKVNSFLMDIHEVTIAQYNIYLEETGAAKPDFWQPELDKANDPVIGLTWREAADYAAWAGKRLPTEAEWECAAKNGIRKNIYPWGGEPDIKMGNYESFGIMPVMSFPVNQAGLYDMGGNVWEWCADWYDKSYYSLSPKNNPKGPFTGSLKILRGGAWYCAAQQVRSSNRYYSLPDTRSFHVGFRCVRNHN